MQQHKIKESWGYYILIQGSTILHGELHGDVYQDPKFLCFFQLQQQNIRIKSQITICSTLTGQMWWQIIYLWARMCWQFIQSRGFWDFTNVMFCKILQMPTVCQSGHISTWLWKESVIDLLSSKLRLMSIVYVQGSVEDFPSLNCSEVYDRLEGRAPHTS